MVFQKGKDPNRNVKGRPPGAVSLVTLIRSKLQDVEPKSKKSYADLLIQSILKKALVDQDHQSQKMILNYLEGLPAQKTILTGENGGPVEHNFTVGQARKILESLKDEE